MNILEIKPNKVMKVDIHKLNEYEARYYLERTIANLDKKIKEITVIHGYRNRQKLLNMVRNDLKGDKIHKKLLSLNPGITSLIINSNSN